MTRIPFMRFSLSLFLASAICFLGLPAFAASPEGNAFRVCADPNNLPFSNSKGEGFENKIAELFAKELGLPVEYTWYPQRMGFIRNTLRSRQESGRYKCDIIMGVPFNYPETATSRPYYRSTWMMVYMKGKGLGNLKLPQDVLKAPNLRPLKFGVFGGSPAANWLLKYHLMDQMVPYRLQSGAIEDYTGKVIIEDLLPGNIDVLFIWGPIAGYFAKKHPELATVSMQSENEKGVAFDFAISMGMRQSDKEWKEQINKLIEQNQDKINAILTEYGMPLVKEQK